MWRFRPSLTFELVLFDQTTYNHPALITTAPSCSPRDIIAFSRDYFAHMCEGPESLQEFLAGWERQQRPTTDNQ